MLDKEALFTGTQVNYYFICHRKLWLFSHNIAMEKESDVVTMGKILHEESYKKVEKDVMMERIAIDFVEKKGRIVIHEVKKSKKMEKAHVYQPPLLHILFENEGNKSGRNNKLSIAQENKESRAHQ